MKKHFIPALLAALLLLLASCGGNTDTGDVTTKTPTTSSSPVTSKPAPTTSATPESSTGALAPADEAWKTAFEKDLFDKHGVRPERYEKLADGTYRVYVNINGTVSPYVTVDPLTGEYHEIA